MSGPPDLRDLPTLDRWGDELRDATERAERRTGRRRVPIRRLVVAVAVMLLAVPGAIATRSIWTDPVDRVDIPHESGSTPSVRLAEGRVGPVAWILGASDRGDSRCISLQTFAGTNTMGGACSHLSDDAAQIVFATSLRRDWGFVFGTVAPAVAEVVVTVAGGRSLRVATQAPDPEDLRRAGLPALRTFVAPFRGTLEAFSPPAVVGLDAHGHVLGRAGGRARP